MPPAFREASPEGLVVSLVSVKFGVTHARLKKVSGVKRKTYWTPKEQHVGHLSVLLQIYPDSSATACHLGARCLLQVQAGSAGGLPKQLLTRQVC